MTEQPSPDAPHFEGPVICGGYPWPAATAAAAAPPMLRPTGIAVIDSATGGIGAGEVWTVSGEAGVGVTSLITALSRGLGRSVEVAVTNGHVPTRILARRLTDSADDGAARVSITSWLRVPWLGDETWTLGGAEVVVLDTWDEMWRPPHWDRSPEQRIADARWLRGLARRAGTAVVLTQRRPHGSHRTGTDDVFEDVGDVRLDLNRGDHRGTVELTITSRRGAPWRGPVRVS